MRIAPARTRAGDEIAATAGRSKREGGSNDDPSNGGHGSRSEGAAPSLRARIRDTPSVGVPRIRLGRRPIDACGLARVGLLCTVLALAWAATVSFAAESGPAADLAQLTHDTPAEPPMQLAQVVRGGEFIDRLRGERSAQYATPLARRRDGVPPGGPGEISFRQLGVRDSLVFWRTESPVGTAFSVRADDVVTGARLRVRYQYTSQMGRHDARLRVAVNGEPVASIPMPPDQAGAQRSEDIAIDPRLVADFNRITFHIESPLAECADPQRRNEPLLRIHDTSGIALQTIRIALRDDLASLPRPFFDARDPRRLDLAFAFAEKPAGAAIEAAGVVASWFGALAGYRGAVFTAHLGKLPRGHVVAFALGDDAPPGLRPAPAGPTVAVMANPEDPDGRVLLVSGRDARELKVAATALALNHARLAGPRTLVGAPAEARPGTAYRSANWVRTDRAVKLGDLADVRTLTVAGQDLEPVRLDLRIPPDVFAWKSAGVPIDLRYRYLPKLTNESSVLNVNVNGRFIEAIPLRPEDDSGWRSWFGLTERRPATRLLPDGTAEARKLVHVHPSIITAQSHFNLEYDFDYAGRAGCGQVQGTTLGGTIDPESTVDLSSFRHYLRMPNLAAFSNAGFPFTRVADLSDTAVVLPDAPRASEIGVMLTALGRMGESTGHAATQVTVTPAAAVSNFATKDLLVIGAPNNQPLFKQWSGHMPWNVIDDRDAATGPSAAELWGSVVTWLRSHGTRTGRDQPLDLTVKRVPGDAALVGFQSPLAPGRSVVAVVANREGDYANVLRALVDPERISEIHGAAVTIGANRVDTLASETTYYSGGLGPFTFTQWYFSSHPLRLWGAILLVTLLLAFLLHRYLGGRAARRLGA